MADDETKDAEDAKTEAAEGSKKDEAKKDEAKKDEAKKDEAKKGGPPKPAVKFDTSKKEEKAEKKPEKAAEPDKAKAATKAKPSAGGGIGDDDLEAVKKLQDGYKAIRDELGKIIVGQEQVLEQLLICIFAQGHCLLIGVPGLAKTLMISSLAKTLSLSFSRIQFTPDLMPSDITGTEVIQEDKTTGERKFQFLHGPIFASIILADEINRTPPKTQAALLEAMQEHQVTAGGTRHKLEEPFFVLATQNPIEQEGTYPLPEAQLDRFMFNILVDYPNEDEEFEIMRRTTSVVEQKLEAILSGEEIQRLQEIVRKVPISDHVTRYAMRLTRATRMRTPDAPDFVNEWLSWGAGPRACQYLILGGKARALLHGRHHVSTEDIRGVAHPVLRHRLITNFNAEAEGIDTDKIISRLLDYVESKPVAAAKA